MSEPTITPAALPQAPAPAPSKRRRWPWIVGGTVAVLIVIGIASGPTTDHSTQADTSGHGAAFQNDSNAAGDVTVDKCSGGAEASLGMAQVTVKITNRTSSVQSYLITASVNDAQGNR